MRSRIVFVLLLGVLLPWTVAPLAPAQAAVSGSVSVSAPNAQQSSYDCPCNGTDIAFTVVAPDPSQFLKYTYEVTVTGPYGNLPRRTGEAYYGGTWSWPVYLFPDIDPSGTYKITAVVTYYGYAGNVPIDTKTATSSFTYTGPVGPPPPDPNAPYTSQIKGSVFSTPLWIKSIRSFSATVQSEYRSPNPRETGVAATFRLWLGNKVVATQTLTWKQTGSLKVTVPRKGRTKTWPIRIEINGQFVYGRTVKVKASASSPASSKARFSNPLQGP